MTDQPELQDMMLQDMMQKANELHYWFLALQEAGFNELQAYGLLQPLMLAGMIRRED